MTPDDLPADLNECYKQGRTWAVYMMEKGPPSAQVGALFNGLRDAVRDRETLGKIQVRAALTTLISWLIVGILIGAGLVLLGGRVL